MTLSCIADGSISLLKLDMGTTGLLCVARTVVGILSVVSWLLVTEQLRRQVLSFLNLAKPLTRKCASLCTESPHILGGNVQWFGNSVRPCPSDLCYRTTKQTLQTCVLCLTVARTPGGRTVGYIVVMLVSGTLVVVVCRVMCSVKPLLSENLVVISGCVGQWCVRLLIVLIILLTW